jgi:hypothetical protein
MRWIAATIRLVLVSVAALVVTLLLYDRFMHHLWSFAFPEELAARQGPNLNLYGFGLAFPYAAIFSLPAFICLFPFLNSVILTHFVPQPPRAALSGALAWSSPGILLAAISLSSPPLDNGLMERATLILFPGFVAFQAAIGAVAGLLVFAFIPPANRPPASRARRE